MMVMMLVMMVMVTMVVMKAKAFYLPNNFNDEVDEVDTNYRYFQILTYGGDVDVGGDGDGNVDVDDDDAGCSHF